MRRHLPLAIGLIATLGLVVAAGAVAVRSSTPSAKVASASAVRGGVPRSTSPGAHPAGASQAGARAAAIDFATASQNWLYETNAQVAASVRAVSTPGAAASLSAETVSELGNARQGLAGASGPVWWLVRPLASRVDSFDAATAQVVVWVVSILSAPGVALPQAKWMRVSLELAWETGAWRVSGISEAAGPTPVSLAGNQPSSAQSFGAALAGFDRVGSGTGR